MNAPIIYGTDKFCIFFSGKCFIWQQNSLVYSILCESSVAEARERMLGENKIFVCAVHEIS